MSSRVASVVQKSLKVYEHFDCEPCNFLNVAIVSKIVSVGNYPSLIVFLSRPFNEVKINLKSTLSITFKISFKHETITDGDAEYSNVT